MTNEEIETFLNLKFKSYKEALNAFKIAIGYPAYVLPYHVPEKAALAGIRYWVAHGAPKKLDIPKDRTEFFLKVKFGTVKNAYDYWLRCGNTHPNYLSKNELKVVIDYVHAPK